MTARYATLVPSVQVIELKSLYSSEYCSTVRSYSEVATCTARQLATLSSSSTIQQATRTRVLGVLDKQTFHSNNFIYIFFNQLQKLATCTRVGVLEYSVQCSEGYCDVLYLHQSKKTENKND